LENCVAIALRKKALEGRLKFFYWKNLRNEEVDFVLQDGITITHLMQVCADPSDPKVHA